MTTFPFEFEGQSYTAEAVIKNNNGTISCTIPRILDKAGKPVMIEGSIYILKSPKGYIPDATHIGLSITREIAVGLDQYLKDAKIIQYTPKGTEILYVDKFIGARKQVQVKNSQKAWRAQSTEE